MVFLWLALTPVVGVASYSLIRFTPWFQSYQKENWQRRLSDNLGVEVRLGSIEFPSPNQFRATNLVFANPETGQQILTMEEIKVDIDRGGWLVHVVSPVLNGSQVQLVMDSLHDRFLCRPQSSACLLALSMPELLISDRSSNTRFQNVEVGFTPKENTFTLLVRYSLEGQESSQRGSLKVERNHIEESTIWNFNSNETAIPCCVLSERFPTLRHLGSQACFQGTIQGRQRRQNSQMLIRGDVHSVNLAAATMPMGSPIQGLGKLSNLNAMLIDENLREARGSLISNSCSVDTGWLDRMIASNRFYTISNPRWRELSPIAPQRAKNVAVQFTLDERGFKLSGISDPNQLTLAGYIGDDPVGCVEGSIVSMSSVINVLSMYLNPNMEFQPSRIADGRR